MEKQVFRAKTVEEQWFLVKIPVDSGKTLSKWSSVVKNAKGRTPANTFWELWGGPQGWVEFWATGMSQFWARKK